MTITTHQRRHIRHIAREASRGIAAADIEARVAAGTIAGAVEEIRDRIQRRGGRCTVAAARERYEAAAQDAEQYLLEQELGAVRRQKARTDQPASIEARKVAQIRRLLDDVPGRWYSGETAWVVSSAARGTATAQTETELGDPYPGSGGYGNKTDATHRIRLSLSDLAAARRTGLPRSIDGWQVCAAKQIRAGIYSVSLIGESRKRVMPRPGFVAVQGHGRYHLAKTERGAVTALNRAARADEESREARIDAATVSRWGWCAGGVRRWCERHGIRRDISGRLRRGTASQALARLVKRHGGPADSYERRLMLAAG